MDTGTMLFITMALILVCQNIRSTSADNSTCFMFEYQTQDMCMMETKCSDGDVTFGIIANLHRENGDFWCSHVHRRGVEQAAAIKWIFDKLNGNGFINGVKIGNEITMLSCKNFLFKKTTTNE